MRAGLLRTSLRFLTGVCVGLLGLLSLLPGQDMVRTGFPGPLEHFAAYAGSGAIALAGYGLNRGAVRVIGSLWVYAGILEYLQQFSPGQNPALVDFAASAFGALCGGVAVFLLWRWRARLHWDGGITPSSRPRTDFGALAEAPFLGGAYSRSASSASTSPNMRGSWLAGIDVVTRR